MSDLTGDFLKELLAATSGEIVESDLPGAIPSVVIPASYKVEQLPVDPQAQLRPFRLSAKPKFEDQASFCAYFNRFADSASTIFASETGSVFQGILDYHESPGNPRWGAHVATYTLQHSEEWLLWTANHKKEKSQQDFAQFIEDNAPDITDPEPARMLEIARTMTAHGEIQCESVTRKNDGGANVRYSEIVQGKAGPAHQFDIPTEFKLLLPVYLYAERMPVTARLRWRIASGQLRLWYDLWRIQAIKHEAFLAVRAAIEESTKATVLMGGSS